MELPVDRIAAARERGARVLQAARLAVELPAVALAVERHRWAWRPLAPRLLLIAESHVYTSVSDLALTVRQRLLPPQAHHAPPEYVRLVYCLGYGEDELLSQPPERRNAGTRQFWDIFGRVANTGQQPRKGVSTLGERIAWKVTTLSALRGKGIWLLDASLHGIYTPGGERVDPVVVQALHRAWWDEYGSWLIGQMPGVRCWAIGKGVYSTLSTLGLELDGWIYQPNARGASLDREHGWSDLVREARG